jgi:hypothetical protein
MKMKFLECAGASAPDWLAAADRDLLSVRWRASPSSPPPVGSGHTAALYGLPEVARNT